MICYAKSLLLNLNIGKVINLSLIIDQSKTKEGNEEKISIYSNIFDLLLPKPLIFCDLGKYP
jgi:hypothetical protein